MLHRVQVLQIFSFLKGNSNFFHVECIIPSHPYNSSASKFSHKYARLKTP
jgi:hypothetical protein